VRVEPSAEEVALRRKLVRELPDELEAAVAYLDELLEAAEVAAGVASFGGARPALLADLPASAVERLCRHLRGECFECGGPHLVARCPRLLPTAPPPTPKPTPTLPTPTSTRAQVRKKRCAKPRRPKRFTLDKCAKCKVFKGTGWQATCVKCGRKGYGRAFKGSRCRRCKFATKRSPVCLRCGRRRRHWPRSASSA